MSPGSESPNKVVPMLKLTLLSATLALAAVPFAFAFDDKPAAKSVAPVAFTGAIMPAFHVKDVKAAKAWYADVLGFQVVYDLPEQGWCELATPAQDAKLGLSENAETKGSGDAFVSFGVKDMTAAKAALVAKKVKLDGDVVTIPGTVKLLYFTDPDGNRLMFFEPLTAAAK